MEYLIPAVLVLLVVGGFVTFLVLNATKKSGPVASGDAPGIGADETPLGDTTQHAGDQTEQGTTARDPETGGGVPDDPDAAAHVARPGEGEGHERLEFEGERPAAARADATPAASERPEDRPTQAAAEAAPDERSGEPGSGEDDDEPAPPASERLADRGV